MGLLLPSMAVYAEKTISYYTENAGERIDRVLACRDGADDPKSLGCRNARFANDLDFEVARKFADETGSEKAKEEFNEQSKELIVTNALRQYRLRSLNVNCVNIKAETPPATNLGKLILKVALQEKLIEPQSGQADKYRTTKRGAEFLRVQMHTDENGLFCPVDIQYSGKREILEFQDLTSQYKGKTNKYGDQIKMVRASKVQVILNNTGASVWFARKLFPSPLPLKGTAIAQFVSFELANRKGLFSAGGLSEVDGKPRAEITPENLLANFK
ncbi:MAG TPA: hypothetical protein VE934_08745 [Polaromonas sp.]|nr:hypothetical protein [Polaromonas sp.]